MVEKQITEDITEFVKLMRNSKGYTWEIKSFGLDIDKVEKLNQEMLNRFS